MIASSVKNFVYVAVIFTVLLMPAKTNSQESIPGFDASTGIWFPPAASPDVYKNNHPAKNFGKDLLEAFQADPKKASQICKFAVNHSPELGENTPPRIRQLKTMFDMTCSGFLIEQKEQNQKQAQHQKLQTYLSQLFDLNSIATIDREERWRKADELRQQLLKSTGCDRFRLSIRLLTLKPEDLTGMFYAIQDVGSCSSEVYVTQNDLNGHIRKLFTEKAQANDLDSVYWKLGLRNHLYLTGKNFERARDLTKEALRFPREIESPQTEQVFLGLLERVLGDDQPLMSTLEDCEDCAVILFAITTSGIQRLQRKSPEVLTEVLLEQIRDHPDNWMLRMDSIETIAMIDTKKAQQQYQLVLVPETEAPVEARLDALTGLEKIANKRGDLKKAITLIDQWLALSQFKPASFVQEDWSKLVTLPRYVNPEALHPHVGTIKLATKATYLTGLREFSLAEKTIEAFLGATLKIAPEYAPRTRSLLKNLAQAEIQNGLTSEPLKILGYLAPQVRDIGDPSIESLFSQVAKNNPSLSLMNQQSPW